MIYGTGVDIVDSKRIEKLLKSFDQKAKNKLFTLKEQHKAESRKESALTYSKIFAAKEAFIKALGHSFGLSWVDIEVLNNDLGKPFIHLSQNAKNLLVEICKTDVFIHLSLSDEKPYAIAFVVIES
ncbi:MAG: Holo-[acyl-carrier-protein] synthase [Holosporales bacterium]